MTNAFAITSFQELPDVVLEKERLQAELRANRSANLRSVPAGSAFAGSDREYSDDERNALPGTRLDLALSVSEFLERAFDMQLNHGGMTFPDGSGGYESGKRHVLLHAADDDGIERATVYGEYTAQCLGVEPDDGSHSTFSFLISAFCEGDARLAARIASHFLEKGDLDGMIDLLVARPTADELRNALPIRLAPPVEMSWAPDEDVAPAVEVDVQPNGAIIGEIVDGAVVEVALAATLTAAVAPKKARTVLDGFVEGQSVRLPVGNPLDGEFVQIGGKNTGYYYSKSVVGVDDRVTVIDVPITTWIAFRSRSTQQMILTPDGGCKEAGPATFSVRILTSTGYTTEVHDLSAAESVDCRKVLERANAGIPLPIKLDDRARVNNMLMTLGWSDSQEKAVEYTSTGIARMPDGTHALLLPAGSMTAKGVDKTILVDAPAKSEEGALQPAQLATGFDRIAEGVELRVAAGSIAALLQCAPKRTSAVIAMLGGIAAAFMPLSRKTTVMWIGATGTGKSLLLSCGQSFFSGIGITGADFSMNFQNASRVGAEVSMAWANCSPFFADDFRFDGDATIDAKMKDSVNGVIQAAYGASGALKATAGRGLKASSKANTMAFVSGEGTPPSGVAVINRMVTIIFEKGEILNSPIGTSPIDEFKSVYGDSGLARAFMANFARWLVSKVDEAGGVIAFRGENDRLKNEWAASRGTARASENSATLAVGWIRMIEWAEEMGIADLLPSMEEVSDDLAELVTSNVAAAEEIAYGRVITEEIGDMISGGKGYVVNCVGKRPQEAGSGTNEGSDRYGWFQDEDRNAWSVQGREKLGILSADGRRVLILPTGMKTVKARLRNEMSASQFGMVLQDFVSPGTKPNMEAPSSMGIRRQRGYIFDVEALGLPVLKELPIQEIA